MKTTEGWDDDEAEVFEKLGVSEDNVSLRNFIRGQRKINGRLFTAIKLILASMPELAAAYQEGNDKIARAREINDGVPGPPPGCDVSELGPI